MQAPVALSGLFYRLVTRHLQVMAEFARRPVPVKPSHAARRGTVMHEWIEEFYETRSRLPGIEEPHRGDEDLDDTFDLSTVKERFTQTEWAHRRLYAAEIPVETTLDGVVVRGRIDAIFGKDQVNHQPDHLAQAGGVLPT